MLLTIQNMVCIKSSMEIQTLLPFVNNKMHCDDDSVFFSSFFGFTVPHILFLSIYVWSQINKTPMEGGLYKPKTLTKVMIINTEILCSINEMFHWISSSNLL